MGAGKAIKHVLLDRGITITGLSDEMGVPRQTMANKICYDKMTIESVLKIANHINCQLVLRDNETGAEYIID